MLNNDFKTLSKLAMISLTEEEMTAFESDVKRIRAMADALLSLDLEDGAPKAVTTLNKLRPDTVTESEDPLALVASAPTHDGGYITVPAAKEEVE